MNFEIQEEQFQLTPAKGDTAIKLANYDDLKAKCEQIAAKYSNPIITSDDDKRDAKRVRADINRLADGIDDRRKATTRDYVSTWEDQCKSLVKILKDCTASIGASLEAYEKKEPKEAFPTFTVKTASAEEADKVRNWLKKSKIKFTER